MNDIPTISIQELMEKAPDDREQQRFIEVKLRIPSFGHERQVWGTVLSLMRVVQLKFGCKVQFFSGPMELTDTLADDEGESWHALDWTGDPELKGKSWQGPPKPQKG